MNKKIIILWFLIVAIVSLNLFLIVKLKTKDHQLTNIINSCNLIEKQSKIFTKSIKDKLEIETRNEGIILTKQPIGSFYQYPHLILRLNTKGCQGCITQILNALNNISDNFKEKIFVIGSFETITEFEYYKQNLFKEFKVIDINTENFQNNELEANNISYFLTIDENNKIRNLFIPDKNLQFLTIIYLENIFSCVN